MRKRCPLWWKRRLRSRCTAGFVAWSTMAGQGVCRGLCLFARLAATLTGLSPESRRQRWSSSEDQQRFFRQMRQRDLRQDSPMEDNQSCLHHFTDHFCGQRFHQYGGSGGTSSQCLAAKRLGGKPREGPGNRVQ